MRSRKRLLQRSRVHLHERSRKRSNVCPFSSLPTHVQLCFWLAARTRTARAQHVFDLRFAHVAAARGFAHIHICAAALLFFFCAFRVRSLQRSQRESCGELRSRTEPCFRSCKRRGRRLHKTIRSQTHVDVHANVDARSVAFSRARPLCGQSLPLLPIATAGAQNAPASFFGLASLEKKKKQLSKTAAKFP